MLIDGFTLRQPLVKIISDKGGTLLGTGTASRAFALINIPCLPAYRDLKIAGFPCQFFHFAIGHEIYVGMPTGIQKLGRQNSDSAVISGKCFVQLGHLPANAGQSLYQLDLYTHLRQIQCSLDPSYTTSYDQHILDQLIPPL